MQQQSQPYSVYKSPDSLAVQHRDPPPYPGYAQPQYQHSGYRQSYASSETGSTDMSLSSCENINAAARPDLTPDDFRMACCSVNQSYDQMGAYFNTYQAPCMESLPTSAVEVKSANSSTFYVTGSMNEQGANYSSYTAMPALGQQQQYLQQPGCIPSPHSAYQQYSMQADPHHGGTVLADNNTQHHMLMAFSNNNQYYQSQQKTIPPPPVNPAPMGVRAPVYNRQLPVPTHHNLIHTSPLPQNSNLPRPPPIPRNYVNSTNQQVSSSIPRPNPNYLPQRPSQLSTNTSAPGSNYLQRDYAALSSRNALPKCEPDKNNPFKKWRHFYVNEKNRSHIYRSNSGGTDTDATEAKSPEMEKPHPTVNESIVAQSKKDQNSNFSGKTDPQNLPRVPSGSENPAHSRLNATRVGDKLRSATPDFLSERPQLSRLLPTRPNSANNKQRVQLSRPHLSYLQLKAQKFGKVPPSAWVDHMPSPDGPPKALPSPTSTMSVGSDNSQRSSENTSPATKQRPSTAGLPRPKTAPPIRSRNDSGQSKRIENDLHSYSSTNENSLQQVKKDLCRSFEKLNKLAKANCSEQRDGQIKRGALEGHACNPKEDSTDSCDSRHKSDELDHAAIATRATRMVEKLSKDNNSLREELYIKHCKLQKFEEDLSKMTEEYESLVKHSSKLEHHEKQRRQKLENEIKRLKENNQTLQASKLDDMLSTRSCSEECTSCQHQEEVEKKDHMLAKLLSQNRELSKAKDKLEVEIATERAKAEKGDGHIEALETALKNCQTNVVRLREENERLKQRTAKTEEYHASLTQLQKAQKTREEAETRLRTQLEQEIQTLKQPRLPNKTSDTDEGISSDYESARATVEQIADLRQTILRLETQVAFWQQRCHEETALRHLAVEAASTPRDARIAALEQNAQETERLINEARMEKLRHLEEVYKSNKKAAELEAKVKTLQAQIAEKDAMLQVLERQSVSLSRTSSLSSLGGTTSTTSALGDTSSVTAQPSTSPAVTKGMGGDGGTASLVASPLVLHKEPGKPSIHSKPGTDSLANSPVFGKRELTRLDGKELTSKDLRHKLLSQAALFKTWKEGNESVEKNIWQV